MTDTVAAAIAAQGLAEPGAHITCLVSGGADSTCLWHALTVLGYQVDALHVHHGVRGAAADRDAKHCTDVLGAEIVRIEPAATEAEMRELRYAATAGYGLRATGHTASDQIETVLMRLLASGSTRGIRARRDDGVIRPLLAVWREDTNAYCAEHGLPFVEDETNPETLRGRLRSTLLPLLDELEPRSRASLLALGEERPQLPRRLERALVELLESTVGSSQRELGGGITAIREYDELRLEGAVTWGPWRLSTEAADLVVRSRRPGDRLAGRSKKVQDLLVDAKIPRSRRDGWPVVALAGGDVVCVPGVAEAPGFEGVVSVSENEDG